MSRPKPESIVHKVLVENVSFFTMLTQIQTLDLLFLRHTEAHRRVQDLQQYEVAAAANIHVTAWHQVVR